MLSDSERKVATLYGVNAVFFPKRVTFLIDENGVIFDIVKNISLENYGESIIKKFKINSGLDSTAQE